jgi:hypothetical protein
MLQFKFGLKPNHKALMHPELRKRLPMAFAAKAARDGAGTARIDGLNNTQLRINLNNG